MKNEQIYKELKKYYQKYNENYFIIDGGIRPLVDYLNGLGFVTFASCSSHIYDCDNEPINCPQAYVAFWCARENRDKLIQLINHDFPKSKFYDISFIEFKKGTICFNIKFKTRLNRQIYLTRIYESLGIKLTGKVKLGKEPPLIWAQNGEPTEEWYEIVKEIRQKRAEEKLKLRAERKKKSE